MGALMSSIQLQQLGFTQLETDIYLALLTGGDMTGYAVAKQVGKAVANVYKGLASLSQKGAVLQAQQDKKLFCAVPWRHLLDNEQRKFNQSMAVLAEQLEALPEPDDNEQVYQLCNVDQLFYDCQQLIQQAQQMILADLHPAIVPLVAKALIEAAARGVEVRAKVYQPVDLPGVKLTLRDNGAQVYGKSSAIQFDLSVDGCCFITALINASQTAVIQAFKSRSALMNMNIFCGLVYELILTELKPAIQAGNVALAQQVLAQTQHLHPFSSENQMFRHYQQRYHLTTPDIMSATE